MNEQERHEGADAPRRSLAQPQSDPEPPSGPEGYCQKYEDGPPPHPLAPQRARSWYKTRNGIAVTAVVILVMLGAIIGGAMEGTRRNSSNKDSGSSISQAPVASNSSASSTSMARPGFTPTSSRTPTPTPSSSRTTSLGLVLTSLPTIFTAHVSSATIVTGHRNYHR